MPDDPVVRLRAATDSDDPLLQKLFRAARPELALLPLSEDQVDAMISLQWQAQRSGYGAAHPEAVDSVIEADDVPVGRVLVDPGPPLTIIDLAVLPERRGAGIASVALRLVLADADARGIAARLHVRPENPAQRLYARLGFVADSDEGPDVLMVRGPAPGPG